jgi:hypothetical protein
MRDGLKGMGRVDMRTGELVLRGVEGLGLFVGYVGNRIMINFATPILSNQAF